MEEIATGAGTTVFPSEFFSVGIVDDHNIIDVPRTRVHLVG